MTPNPNSDTHTSGNGHALLEAIDVTKHFKTRGGLFGRGAQVVQAVNGVSFHIDRGETLALVGESGCGKSTVGKCLLCLTPLTSGQVLLDGRRIDTLPVSEMRKLRGRISTIFQDPFSSLNPRFRVQDLIGEPLRSQGLSASRADRRKRVSELLDLVRLPQDAMDRLPHEFSGGQRQRICIARALAGKPDIVICDEAVSALDVSVQAQIINLLQDLQAELGLSLLFISHDLAVVEHMSHRVAVMYLGRIVEIAPKRSLFAGARHPYTQALLSAVPVPEIATSARKRDVLQGEVPSPVSPPSGCFFRTRCPKAFARCAEETPTPRAVGDNHLVACHLTEADTEKL